MGKDGGGISEVVVVIDDGVEIGVFVKRTNIESDSPGGIGGEIMDLSLGGVGCSPRRSICGRRDKSRTLSLMYG